MIICYWFGCSVLMAVFLVELGRGRGISNLDKKSPNYKACALNLN